MKPYPENVKAEALRLRAEGHTLPWIGERLGVPANTVLRWTNEEYAERSRATSRALKPRYGGTCMDCGKTTSHGNGAYPGPARRCADCQKVHDRAAKVWTREAVLDAIQRFADVHGRPPKANEWIRADPINNYPCRASVYRAEKEGRSSPPFAAWADAIEAAGFPRPRKGHYERTPEIRRRMSEARLRRRAA